MRNIAAGVLTVLWIADIYVADKLRNVSGDLIVWLAAGRRGGHAADLPEYLFRCGRSHG